jgi:helix-turn-helix protein
MDTSTTPTAFYASVTDASRAAGLSVSTIYNLVRSGHVRLCKAGRRSLVSLDSLRSYLDGLPDATLLYKPPAKGGSKRRSVGAGVGTETHTRKTPKK